MLLTHLKRELPSEVREKFYFLWERGGIFLFELEGNLREIVSLFKELRKLKEENALLKRKLRELTFWKENVYEELLLSCKRLKKLLEFKEKMAYSLLPARVVGIVPFPFTREIIIDRGEKDGVTKDAVVVHPEGLVGRVSEVYTYRSRVLLLTDERSMVGVRVERTRDIGLLQGEGGGKGKILYLTQKAELRVGDRVVTSGLGGIFPPGIGVGKIVEIEKDPSYLFQKVRIEFLVDFTRLEEVLVLFKGERK